MTRADGMRLINKRNSRLSVDLEGLLHPYRVPFTPGDVIWGMISCRCGSDVAPWVPPFFGDILDGVGSLDILGAWPMDIRRGGRVPSPEGGLRWWLTTLIGCKRGS